MSSSLTQYRPCRPGASLTQVYQRLLDLGFTEDALLLHAHEALEAGYINIATFEQHHLGA